MKMYILVSERVLPLVIGAVFGLIDKNITILSLIFLDIRP